MDEFLNSIDFSEFQLEKDYDFLWIYDGDNVYAPKIGRWNTKSPGRVEATGNVMCLEFRSDCATSELGWRAVWNAELPEPPEPEPEPGVYPNPTNDKFTIYSDNLGFTDVMICDLLGNRIVPFIRFQDSIEIDVSNWAPGVYIVHYGKPIQMEKTIKLVKF